MRIGLVHVWAAQRAKIKIIKIKFQLKFFLRTKKKQSKKNSIQLKDKVTREKYHKQKKYNRGQIQKKENFLRREDPLDIN